MQEQTQSLTQYIPQADNEISVYSGKIATKDHVKSETKSLMAAFPDVNEDFIALLTRRLIDNKFTNERVTDAINHVIDTSPYKRPAIADIISFDRKVKIFTYKEIRDKCRPDYLAFDRYERIEINGKKRFIEI